MSNVGKEVICVRVPTNEDGTLSSVNLGMSELIVVAEVGDMYNLKNSAGLNGFFPRNCFRTFEEIDLSDYLDGAVLEIEDIRYLAEKKNLKEVMSTLERIKNELSDLATELREEASEI